MGFQSGVNQILGAGAAAAVAIASDQEKKKIAQEQGLLAKEQYHGASADLLKIQQQQDEANKAIKAYDEGLSVKDAQGALDKAVSKKQKRAASKELKAANQRYTSKEAAEHSLAILDEEKEAKLAIQSRAEAIMKRTNTWEGMK